jgi:hypothetical protein
MDLTVVALQRSGSNHVATSPAQLCFRVFEPSTVQEFYWGVVSELFGPDDRVHHSCRKRSDGFGRGAIVRETHPRLSQHLDNETRSKLSDRHS